MTVCQYCGADVLDLGNHFGGYKCTPCPEVRMALDDSYWPVAKNFEPMQ